MTNIVWNRMVTPNPSIREIPVGTLFKPLNDDTLCVRVGILEKENGIEVGVLGTGSVLMFAGELVHLVTSVQTTMKFNLRQLGAPVKGIAVKELNSGDVFFLRDEAGTYRTAYMLLAQPANIGRTMVARLSDGGVDSLLNNAEVIKVEELIVQF